MTRYEPNANMHGHKIFTSCQHLLAAVKNTKIVITQSFFKLATWNFTCEYKPTTIIFRSRLHLWPVLNLLLFRVQSGWVGFRSPKISDRKRTCQNHSKLNCAMVQYVVYVKTKLLGLPSRFLACRDEWIKEFDEQKIFFYCTFVTIF